MTGITVTNLVGTTISNTAVLIINSPPIISTQPRSQTVLAGGSVTFVVVATASPAPTYQWRLNGSAIAGATAASYGIGSVQAAGAGNYDVVVSNPLGQVVSSLAQLSVASAPSVPVITSQPANRTAVVGSATSLSVVASGAPTPTYQWRRGSANLSEGGHLAGTTTSTMIINPATVADLAADYHCVVTNACGSISTNYAAVTTNGCPADFNCSGGQPTVTDIFAFLTAWFAADPSADFDGSGPPPTVSDIFAFLTAWFAGC